MTRPAQRRMRTVRRGAFGVGNAILAVAAPSVASAQTLVGGIDVSLSGEAVSNPYLEPGSADMTAAVTAEVRPWVSQQTEVTSFNLSAFVQARQFSDDQDREDNYGASAELTHRASERVTLTGRATLRSIASRARGIEFPGLDPNPQTPVPEPEPLDPGFGLDPSLLGTRGRTTQLSGGIGTQYAIDARRSLRIDLDLEDLDFSHANGQDYRTHAVSSSLTQVIDSTTSVGATVNLSLSDYANPSVADARIVTAMGSVSHRLDQRWTLDASAGASVARVEAAGPFPSRESTGISATVSLCRREARGGLCIDYQRQPRPTGLGDVRDSDSANLSYNLAWSARTQIAVGASYTRTGEAVNVAAPDSGTEYVSVRATLDRAFNQRVSGFVTASASRVFQAGQTIEPNINVGLGIRIRLGRRR